MEHDFENEYNYHDGNGNPNEEIHSVSGQVPQPQNDQGYQDSHQQNDQGYQYGYQQPDQSRGDKSYQYDYQYGYQQQYDQGYRPYGAPQDNQPNKKGLGIVSMILGILSILFTCCCTYMGIMLGIPAIITGIIAIKKNAGKGCAIAGLITGVFGLVFSIVGIIIGAYMVRTGFADQMLEEYEKSFGINLGDLKTF